MATCMRVLGGMYYADYEMGAGRSTGPVLALPRCPEPLLLPRCFGGTPLVLQSRGPQRTCPAALVRSSVLASDPAGCCQQWRRCRECAVKLCPLGGGGIALHDCPAACMRCSRG